MSDPAELETESRKRAGFASTFDNLVASNLQLVKTVHIAIIVMTACTVMSLVWTGFTMYSLRAMLSDMRAMLELLAKGHS